MATINVDDKLIPEAFEADGEFRVPHSLGNGTWEWHLREGCACNDNPWGDPYVILRRKPVLDHVVLRVTGPKRKIGPREHYLDHFGEIRLWTCGRPSHDDYIPLSAPVQVTK